MQPKELEVPGEEGEPIGQASSYMHGGVGKMELLQPHQFSFP